MRLIGRFGLALLGVVVAAGIGLAASRLVSQPIGLSGEPVTAGGDLAPASEPEPVGRTRTTTTVTTTEAAPPSRPSTASPPAEGGDDERGEAPDGDD